MGSFISYSAGEHSKTITFYNTGYCITSVLSVQHLLSAWKDAVPINVFEYNVLIVCCDKNANKTRIMAICRSINEYRSN